MANPADPDNRCYEIAPSVISPSQGADDDHDTCCLPFWHAGAHKSPDGQTWGHRCPVTIDPIRWPLTSALEVVLTNPDDHDADNDLRATMVDAAIILGIGVESLGYISAPAAIEDCRWYREQTGHELGDLDYGRWTSYAGACIEAR